jgi:hypothetical protein
MHNQGQASIKTEVFREWAAQGCEGKFYMCAVVAIKYNPDCRSFYTRLKESGKPSKVALIAVANKLLRQLYAVLTKKEAYVPNFCTKAS